MITAEKNIGFLGFLDYNIFIQNNCQKGEGITARCVGLLHYTQKQKMRYFKWKIFAVTAIVCLLPIFFGVAVWEELPEKVAVHFDMYGVADDFASKEVAVFGIPMAMIVFQWICCLASDINSVRYGDKKQIVTVTKWIIPCLSVVLQTVTLGYAVGWQIDMRKTVAVIVGVLLIVVGFCMPKYDYIRRHPTIDTEKAKKINRFVGYETVILGLMFVLSVFLPPESTVACLFMLIPFAVISAVYGVVTARKK